MNNLHRELAPISMRPGRISKRRRLAPFATLLDGAWLTSTDRAVSAFCPETCTTPSSWERPRVIGIDDLAVASLLGLSGAPRIHGELLKLGFVIAEST